MMIGWFQSLLTAPSALYNITPQCRGRIHLSMTTRSTTPTHARDASSLPSSASRPSSCVNTVLPFFPSNGGASSDSSLTSRVSLSARSYRFKERFWAVDKNVWSCVCVCSSKMGNSFDVLANYSISQLSHTCHFVYTLHLVEWMRSRTDLC